MDVVEGVAQVADHVSGDLYTALTKIGNADQDAH